ETAARPNRARSVTIALTSRATRRIGEFAATEPSQRRPRCFPQREDVVLADKAGLSATKAPLIRTANTSAITASWEAARRQEEVDEQAADGTRPRPAATAARN